MSSKYKRPDRITNWKEYNSAIELRGSLAVQGVLLKARAWRNNKTTGERGRPEYYNPAFLEAILVLMTALRQPLRQTRGLAVLLLKKQKIPVPSIATLCRYRQNKGVRAKIFHQARIFQTALATAQKQGRPLTLSVDSTGISVRGIGTWRSDKPGSTEKSRRTFWKLHNMVDPVTGQIVIARLLANPGISDASVGTELLKALPVGTVSTLAADGAYDTKAFYKSLEDSGIKKSLVKPREKASPWRITTPGAYLRIPLITLFDRSKQIVPGSLAWKKRTGYSVRSLIETTYSRLASIGANKPRARSNLGRAGEIATAIELLNAYASLGLPNRYQRQWSVA